MRTWSAGGQEYALPDAGSVLVVRARLAPEYGWSPSLIDGSSALLAPADHAHIARKQRVDDRLRSAIGRSLLRQALGAWWGMPPSQVPLQWTARGKPWLPDGPAVSVSHAGDRVLVAFGHVDALGVDVEAAAPAARGAYPLDVEGIAERCWHPLEQRAWRQCAEPERRAWFFRQWTAKEAVVKALGGGVDDMPLIACELATVTSGRVVALPGAQSPAGWHVVLRQDDAGYPLAVAARVRGSAHPLRLLLQEVHQHELPQAHRVGEVGLAPADLAHALHELHERPIAGQHERVDHDAALSTGGHFA